MLVVNLSEWSTNDINDTQSLGHNMKKVERRATYYTIDIRLGGYKNKDFVHINNVSLCNKNLILYFRYFLQKIKTTLFTIMIIFK